MSERLDGVLLDWRDAWRGRDVDTLVDLYRPDALLHWIGVMPTAEWGDLGIRDALSAQLCAVVETDAWFAPSAGPDDGLSVARFRQSRDADVYELPDEPR